MVDQLFELYKHWGKGRIKEKDTTKVSYKQDEHKMVKANWAKLIHLVLLLLADVNILFVFTLAAAGLNYFISNQLTNAL